MTIFLSENHLIAFMADTDHRIEDVLGDEPSSPCSHPFPGRMCKYAILAATGAALFYYATAGYMHNQKNADVVADIGFGACAGGLVGVVVNFRRR